MDENAANSESSTKVEKIRKEKGSPSRPISKALISCIKPQNYVEKRIDCHFRFFHWEIITKIPLRPMGNGLEDKRHNMKP